MATDYAHHPDCIGHDKEFGCKVPPSERTFIEQILSQFREKFVRDDGLMDKYYEYSGGEVDDYVCPTAEAIEGFLSEKLEEIEKREMDRRDAMRKVHDTQMAKEVVRSYTLGVENGYQSGRQVERTQNMT